MHKSRKSPSRALPSLGGDSPLCQSESRVKLIHGLSSASKVEDLWTTRLSSITAKLANCGFKPRELSHTPIRSVCITLRPWLNG